MRLWPEFSRWKINCPQIRGVHLLDHLLIGENAVTIKMKFYEKDITLVNEDRSVTFVFYRTDKKKEELLKSN